MINVLEPQHELLKQFVDSIYVLRKSGDTLEFTAYPSVNTPVALLRDATVSVKDGLIYINSADSSNHFAVACNQFSGSTHLQYLQSVDEIAINFKPLGFSTYTRTKPGHSKIFTFQEWDRFLPALFTSVFETEDPEQQLGLIEDFLLKQYTPLSDEAVLLKVLALLADTGVDYKMQEIADLAGKHYKQLYRLFTEQVGCSPTHYRKLLKFRSSVVSKLKKGDKARLVDICYAHDYTDQPYFIKQFKELTGKNPARFFKEITSFGDDKVIFRMD
jgi:AraC-like DNA-binding protein